MGELDNDNSIVYNKGKRDAYGEILDLVGSLVFQHEYVSEDLFYGYVTALKDIHDIICVRYGNTYGACDVSARDLEDEEEEENEEPFVDSIQREIHEGGRITYKRRNISL